jgi:hypothetical protein
LYIEWLLYQSYKNGTCVEKDERLEYYYTKKVR